MSRPFEKDLQSFHFQSVLRELSLETQGKAANREVEAIYFLWNDPVKTEEVRCPLLRRFIPTLSGVIAPVRSEDDFELKVVGRFPDALVGAIELSSVRVCPQ